MSSTLERLPRVLLTLPGGAFAGTEGLGIDPIAVKKLAAMIVGVVREGTQVAVMCGGGNLYRGSQLADLKRDRADYMNLVSTVINALALQDFLKKLDVDARVLTAVTLERVAEPYIPGRAIRHLEKGRVVIFAAGLGLAYIPTEMAAAQRALEIHARRPDTH